MATANKFHPIRLTVMGCVLFGLLVAHLAIRYLHISLFGFVKYRGLAPVVPWVILGAYILLLGVLAVVAVYRLERNGLAIGTGLLLFAVEPFTILNGGCQVSSSAGLASIPRVAWDGAAIVIWAWNGSCSMYLAYPLVAVALLLVAVGMWVGSLPDVALSRWRHLLGKATSASSD